MVVYEVCSVYVKFAETQCIGDYADYKLGMVFNSSAPWDVEAEYDSLEEAEKDFANRRSSVECKGGILYFTEVFLIKEEFSGYDEEGYAIPPVTWSRIGNIAPIGDTELADVLIGLWSSNKETYSED
jgi:hypothetical protein